MYKWYADDSALKTSISGLQNNPVFLFGGILISRNDEVEFNRIIKSIKSEYTFEDMPIKYNIKDVEDRYKHYDKLEDFNRLKGESKDWRKRIIQESLQFDYKIIIACIENKQPQQKKQKPIKENLSSYLFANALMRVGLQAEEAKIEHLQVILDWPEGNQSKPFDREYYYAYNRGTNSDGQEYFCGPLKKLGFDQSVYYARCNHSNMLQFADIVLGATRDWIQTNYDGRKYSIGKELTGLFMPKFRGYPNKVLGQGLNVSTGSHGFRSQLKTIIKENIG